MKTMQAMHRLVHGLAVIALIPFSLPAVHTQQGFTFAISGSVAIRKSAGVKARSAGRSDGQRIELVCGGRNLPVEAGKLPFLDPVDCLNTGQQNARTTEALEAEHGPDDALDGPMVLFDGVVQVLHLTQFNRAPDSS